MMECWRCQILKDIWRGIKWKKDILTEKFYPDDKKKEAGSKKHS